MKMTTFIVGLLLMSMFAGIFGIVMATSRDTLSPGSYSDKNFESIAKLEDLTNEINNVKTKSEDLSSSGSTFDLVGGFFSDAYAALKISFLSLNTFETMSQETISQLPVSDGEDEESSILLLISKYLSLIVVVLITIGVMISAAIKRDL